MVGIIVGTVCLVGLVKVVGHRHGYHGCHGHRGHAHWGRRHRRRRPSDPRERMELLLDQLDVSEEQEAAIKDHVRAFYKRAKKHRNETERSRDDIAEVMRSESFDENILGEMFVRHDDALRELRKDSVELLAHIHYVLDAEQRRKLASIIESGPRWFGGPYRGWR